MVKIKFSWPSGKEGAFTTSWDDGEVHDRRLVKILDQHGIKGTWNLNSGLLFQEHQGDAYRLNTSEIRQLFQNHEVACHTLTHPFLDKQPEAVVLHEILEDRRILEDIMGYPIKGVAIPFGSYDQRILRLIEQCGIVYSRTTNSHFSFKLPSNFLEWHPTCHPKVNLIETWKRFLSDDSPDKLFSIWGHSHEFERDDEWKMIESFFEKGSRIAKIWYATNIEIYEYVNAWRNLWCSINSQHFRNIFAVDVWMWIDEELICLKGGDTLCLKK
jgi:peptidoglycan-N-acetylglucosamine deacetylase